MVRLRTTLHSSELIECAAGVSSLSHLSIVGEVVASPRTRTALLAL